MKQTFIKDKKMLCFADFKRCVSDQNPMVFCWYKFICDLVEASKIKQMPT